MGGATSIRDFSKVGDAVAIPDLIEIQTHSYARFLQEGVETGKRKAAGLEALLREVFPIESYDENMMLELYNNPPEEVPDYRKMNPLSLHIAFCVDDVAAVRRQLIAAGATPYNEIASTPAGDVLTILRDPWGVPIQFVTRAKPMLK